MEDNNGLDHLDGIVDELIFDDRILEENLGILPIWNHQSTG